MKLFLFAILTCCYGFSVFGITGIPEPRAAHDVSKSAERSFTIDIPVFWQVTRARILRSGATTQTESYREKWSLHIRSGGYAFLESPRSEVPVYLSGGDRQARVPKNLLLSARDFAKLIGVDPGWPKDPGSVDENKAQLVTLSLSQSPRAISDFSLDVSDEEHFAVRLEVGETAAF